jgi:hypothetical protein
MENSGFFNSNSGDRIYDATDFAAYFGDLVSNGIFYSAATNLQVAPSTEMNVTLDIGSAWINGYHYQNTAAFDLALATADGVNPRVDRVVLRLDMTTRSIVAAVVTGVPASTPTAPDLTRNANTYELGLATVSVPRAATSIAADGVTDTRLDSSVCGLVNSLVSAVYE